MKKYLSHGMGVNSTALMLLLEDEGHEFESVFANHAGDYPETYEYLGYLRSQGHDITEIIPDESGCSTLEEYCLKYHIAPMRMRRWCTDKFKIRPMHKYFEKPCTCYIGICKDEEKRVYNAKPVQGITTIYPLIEQNITRKDCIEIIQKHGLKVPPKSGCWLCPFMGKIEVRQLMLNHPDLYERRKRIEKQIRIKDGGKPIFLGDKPIEEISMENIPTIETFLEV